MRQGTYPAGSKFGLGEFHQQLVGERRLPSGRFKAQLDALVGFQEIGGG